VYLRFPSLGSLDSVVGPLVLVTISPSSPNVVSIRPNSGSALGGPLKRCRLFLGIGTAAAVAEDDDGPAPFSSAGGWAVA